VCVGITYKSRFFDSSFIFVEKSFWWDLPELRFAELFENSTFNETFTCNFCHLVKKGDRRNDVSFRGIELETRNGKQRWYDCPVCS
jgi:hypothetical protein